MTPIPTALGGRPHSRWLLGDIPDLVRHYDDVKIETEEQLDSFISQADADLRYGSKLLLAIDRARLEATKRGVTRDLLADVEAQTGDLMPVGESTRKCLTSIPSRTGQRELVVALESSGKYGKVALLLIMLAALLKIVGWFINNGGAYNGAGADGGDAYAEKVKEKDTSSLPEDSIADKLTISVLKDSYIDKYKDLEDGQRVKFNTSMLYLNEIFARAKAEEYLNSLAAASKGKPLSEVVEACASGEYKGQLDIVKAAVSELMMRRVTAGIYTKPAAQNAWKMMPKEFQEGGIQIPCELIFINYHNGIDELSDCITNFSKGFQGLQKLDLNKVAASAGNVVSISGNRYNDELDGPARAFADSTAAFINGVVRPCVYAPTNGFGHDGGLMGPLLILPDDKARNLIGYELGYDIPGAGGRSLHVATQSAYFGPEALEAVSGKGFSMSADSAISLINVITSLGPKALTKSSRVTNLSKYTELNNNLERLRKDIEAWGKSVRDQSSEAMDQFNEAIAREIKRPMTGGAGDSLGFTNMIFQANPSNGENMDFYKSVSMVLQMTKTVCRAAASLQGIIDKTDKNPFVIK